MRCDGLVAEVQDWAVGLEEVHARIAGAFARAEPRARVLAYLRGLLGQSERKNGWTLAEAAGEGSPDGLQRVRRAAGGRGAGRRGRGRARAPAGAAGEVSPDGLQRLLRTADWHADVVRDELRSDVVEGLGGGGGVVGGRDGVITQGAG